MSRARDFADLAGSADEGGLTGRNLFINGAMQVAQRGTSSTASGMNTVDRFNVQRQGTDQLAVTQSQSTTVPSGQGFSNSLKVEVTTAENSMAATEFFRIIQRIEAQNLQHLAFGSSSAKPLTLSFWVRSSLTGKYSILFFRGDASPSRSNTPSYNINVADTWEYKTITIDGDITGGVIANDNGQGLNITWVLAAGAAYSGTPHNGWGDYSATDDFSHSDQVNFADQTGTFYLTGVQLEVGETATQFEHEDYGTTLHKCMRYFQLIDNGIGKVTGLNNNVQMLVQAAFDMRATPSLAVTTLRVTDCTTADYNDATVTVSAANVNLRGGRVNLGMSSTAAVGTTVMLQGTGTNAAPVQLSAEL